MSADRINHCGLLADEEMARAMEHQTTLLVSSLGRHEPHIWPGDRFADGLRVGGIVLLPLDVRLHVGRRHQTHRVPQLLEFPRPMMRRSTSLHADKAWWQLAEEGHNLTALQLTADDHVALHIDAMNLEDRLCDIETDRGDRLHDCLLRIRSPSATLALTCRWRSRPQHHEPTFHADSLATADGFMTPIPRARPWPASNRAYRTLR